MALEQYDTIDMYVDHDAFTQYIDPLGTAPWIRDGTDNRHMEARNHGRMVREKQLSVLLPMVAAASETEAVLYVPSVAEWEKLPKFSSRAGAGNRDCDTWRGGLRDVRGVGSLPVLMKQLRDDEFGQKDRGQVAREVVLENVSRIYDRSGVPDHGRYCAADATE
jgi:hypothetical protein